MIKAKSLPPRAAARRVRNTYIVLLAVTAVAGGGCQAHRIQGLIVQGPTPTVVIVDKDDEQLDRHGLAGAVVELTLDPNSMSPKVLGTVITDATGRFQIPIDAFGVGVLEYDLGMLCRLGDHQPVYQTMRLPASGKCVLVVMAPGRDATHEVQDLIAETLRLGGQPDPRR